MQHWSRRIAGSLVLLNLAPGLAAVPEYRIYAAPPGLAEDAGEPTIGVNDQTGSVFVLAGLRTLRVQFDDLRNPAGATWKDVSGATTSRQTLDPYLTANRYPGADGRAGSRIFVAQLQPGGQNAIAYSDDDGATWQPSPAGAFLHAGADFPSLAVGPYPAGFLLPHLYPQAVYYCARDSNAYCSRSDDGGNTFGPGVPVLAPPRQGLCPFGFHVEIGADGALYFPVGACIGGDTGTYQGLAASRDAGASWEFHPVPDSSHGSVINEFALPSVSAATDGTLYFAYSRELGVDMRAWVTVSHDGGATWMKAQDVGAPAGIQTTVFPVVIAGDGDRAAYAFLGSVTAGDPNAADFAGIWHLYVAMTYNGGQSWTLINVTGDDPVQRGPICMYGVACAGQGTRNLLDFIDATLDREGRVLVAFADGCIDACVTGPPNSKSARASIARQISGEGLYGPPQDTRALPSGGRALPGALGWTAIPALLMLVLVRQLGVSLRRRGSACRRRSAAANRSSSNSGGSAPTS